MKIEENTDYESYNKHKKLIITFVTVLLIGLIVMLFIVTKQLTVISKELFEENQLAKGVVPQLVEFPYENQKEPKDLCGLEVINCDEEEVMVEEETKWTSVSVCSTDNGFKSYMDYRMITNQNSKQYQLQQNAYTNDYGLREYEGKIMIAIAGFNVGEELKLELETGNELDVVVGDIKADTSCLHEDGSMVEFIVYTTSLSDKVRLMGDVSELYEGKIVNIKRKVI